MTTGATNRKTALLISTSGSFLIPFMASSVNIALPSIGRDLTINAILLSWIATYYLLSTTIFLVPFGKIADIHGWKKTFVYGTGFYTVSSLLLGLSNSALFLIAFLILQGIGAAMMISPSLRATLFRVGPDEWIGV